MPEVRFFTELHPPDESVVIRAAGDGWAEDRPGVFEVRMVPGVGYDRAAIEALARENCLLMAGPGNELSFTEWDALPRSGAGKLRMILVLDPGDLPDQRESTSA